MFIKSNLLAAALAVGYLVGGTHAGAGKFLCKAEQRAVANDHEAANVNGCVWYATKPITSFNVTFTVPTSVKQCMVRSHSTSTCCHDD